MPTPGSRNALEVAVGAALAFLLAAGVVQLLPLPAAARTSAARGQISPVPLLSVRTAGPRYLMAAPAVGTAAR